MNRWLATVAAVALLAAPAARAWEATGPSLYSTTACPGPTGCSMTATSRDWPNPSPYTVFATLSLPAGTYLVHGKLSYWTRTPVPNQTWGNNECFIGLADLSQGDYASAGVIGQESVVSMITPLRLSRTTTVQIGCKLFGAYYDTSGEHPVEVVVWDARLIAERK